MIRLFVVQSGLPKVDHNHHQFMGIENPLRRIKNSLDSLTGLKNICSGYKAQIRSKVLVNLGNVTNKDPFSKIVKQIGLGREISLVITGLKRFVNIKTSGDLVVGRSKVIFQPHDSVVGIIFSQERFIAERLTVDPKSTETGSFAGFSLEGHHHIVVGSDFIGPVLCCLNV